MDGRTGSAILPAMCGRFTNALTWAELVSLYRLTDPPADRAPNLQPRYNVCPTQDVPIVRALPDGGRQLATLRWGLVPFWAKDTRIGYSTINARAETVASKPAFRDAFKHRRCIVPASGFYEWKVGPGGKQPLYITRRDGAPLSFAGLWERWKDRESGQDLESCSIIVTSANELLRPIHDRMPVILDSADFPLWLGEEEAGPGHLQALLRQYPAELIRFWPVSKAVNNPSSQGADLIAEIEAPW